MVTNMPTEKSMMTIKQLYDACRRYKKLYSGSGQEALPTSSEKRKGQKGKTTKIKRIPFDIRYRAGTGMTITGKKVIEDEDEDGDIYRKVNCRVKHTNGGSGRTHDVEFMFYGSGTDSETKCAADCSCEFYMYSCEVALYQEGSARLEEPFEMKIWSNGEGYASDGPNPRAIPVICKHIYGALLAGAAKWKPRGMSIEDRRKLEARERRRLKRQEESNKKREADKKKRELERKKQERLLREKTKTKEIKKEPAKDKKLEKGKPEVKEKSSTTKKPPEIKQPKKYATPPTTKWTKKR